MKGMRWYRYLFLGIGVLGIVMGPWLFTRQTPFDITWLDFRTTGNIGDTIGGITAPIVGLVSIILLWWTLQEQLKFNAKQDQINQEQQKFNDANRVLSMEAHILHLDENLHFGFSGLGRTLEGHGVSSLRLLKDNDAQVTIVRTELEYVIDRVHVIETAVCSMVAFVEKSTLSKEEKDATMGMAEMYLTFINDFYNDIVGGRIKWIRTVDELHLDAVGLPDLSKVMMGKARDYQKRISLCLEICRKALAV